MTNKLITNHKEGFKPPLRQATLCYLVKEDKVLLAMKKRGFAQEKWNGVGGKVLPKETVKQAAIRETQEEIGVTPTSLRGVATLDFYFSDKPDWNQQVIVYLVNKWIGQPKESEEMAPKWFGVKEIPYRKMWKDDPFWLPQVIKGAKIKATFWFDKNQKIFKKKISQIRE